MNPLNNGIRIPGVGVIPTQAIGGGIAAIITIIALVLGLVFGLGSQEEGGSSATGSSGVINEEHPSPQPMPDPTRPTDPDLPEEDPIDWDIDDPTVIVDDPTAPEGPTTPEKPEQQVVQLPDVVVMLAGETVSKTVSFPPTVGVDGSEQVVITNSSGGYTTVSGSINAEDNTLNLRVNANQPEGTLTYRIQRFGVTLAQGELVVTHVAEQEVLTLEGIEITVGSGNGWYLDERVNADRITARVVHAGTQTPVTGITTSVNPYADPAEVLVTAGQGAQPGDYVAQLVDGSRIVAQGTVTVLPQVYRLPDMTIMQGGTVSYDIADEVWVTDKTVGGLVQGEDDISLVESAAASVDATARTMTLTVGPNTQPGEYVAFLYTESRTVALGLVTVTKKVTVDDIDSDNPLDYWIPTNYKDLGNRTNHGIHLAEELHEHDVRDYFRNQQFLTPGSSFYVGFPNYWGELEYGQCSSGYFVTKNGEPYMLTAGHCGRPGLSINLINENGEFVPVGYFTDYYNFNEVADSFDSSYDYALVKITRPDLVIPSIGLVFNLDGWIDANQLRDQDYICRLGVREGLSCGYYSTLYTQAFRQEWGTDSYFYFVNNSNQGDSGGPVFLVNEDGFFAVGVVSHGPTYEGWKMIGAQEIEPVLRKWGLQLYGGHTAMQEYYDQMRS